MVLNKLSIFKLDELLEDCELTNKEVYVGGPVEQNTLHFIYCGEQLLEDSVALGDQLWWGGDFNELIGKYKSGLVDITNFRFS